MRNQVLVLVLATCVLGAKLPYSSHDGSSEVLSRTVSVKTPQRVSSVISHFAPADHRYDATGSVLINRDSEPKAKSLVDREPRTQQTSAPVRTSSPPASLSRTISIKTPARASSVISHFSPADHRYEATGSVHIGTGSSASSKTASPPTARRIIPSTPAVISVAQSQPEPRPQTSSAAKTQKALERTVSVKTPERHSSVISHFTPAVNRYDATGSVIINQGSSSPRKVSVQRVSSKPAPVRSVPAPVRPAPAPVQALPTQHRFSSGAKTQKALERTVSVKTPERHSSVISHFTPADHRYDATGSVIINQGSSSPRKVSVQRVSSSPAPAKPAPVRAVPAPVRPAPAPFKAIPTQQRFSSAAKTQKALERTVSVKTPERHSSVISHFTPAVNRYDATGSVIINQGSSSPRKVSVQHVSSKPAPVRAIPAPVRPAPAPVQALPTQQRFSSAAKTQKAVSRTVSVKTPERQSSVISHFTPAVNRYDATGSVVINQASSGSSKLSAARSSASASRSSTSSGASASRSSTSSGASASRSSASSGASASRSSASSGASASRSSTSSGASASRSSTSSGASASRSSTSSGASASGRAEFASSVSRSSSAPVRSTSSSSKVTSGLTRTVSVRTPERDSNTHSHFSSDDHSFDASGSVKISGSSSSGKYNNQASSFSQSSSLAADSSAQLSSSSNSQRASKASASSSSSHSSSGFGAVKSSQSSSGSFRLAAPVTKASSSSLSADLQAEMQAFRAEAAASGAAAPHFTHDENDDGKRDEYYFNLCIEDHENTNYHCRDEWVGADGITRGWYTVLMPDAYFYNYTYIAHPVKGYQVSVTRRDSGIAMKQVEADIFAPATVFSNKGITGFSDFAVSGVNNQFVESTAMNFDQNSASVFANSFAEAMGTGRSASSGSVPAVSTGYPSHSNGFSIIRDSGSSSSSSGRVQVQSSRGSGSTKSSSSSGASSQRLSSSQSASAARSSTESLQHSRATSGSSTQGSSQSSLHSGATSGSSTQGSSHFSLHSGATSGSSTKGSSRSSQSSLHSGATSGSSTQGSSRSSQSSLHSGATSGSSTQGSSQSSRHSGATSGSSTKGSSQSSLSRTVSIKTPERVSTVISHFTPNEHRFDATGRVTINQASSRDSGEHQFNSASVQSFSSSQSRPAPVKTSASSQSSLSRSVSVKTPERTSTVISHFSPADHRYDATGSVVINSSSQRSSQSTQRSQPTTVKVTPAVVQVQRKPVVISRPIASSAKSSLTRTVSVKTPERHSSVISHFNPADHRYEATGSVNINHESSSSSRQSPRKSVVSVSAAPAPVRPSPAPLSIARSHSSGSQSSLSRTVSVKTPQRHSSVISHFTPADHIYDATGSVVINSASSGSVKNRNTFSATAPVKVAPSPTPAPRRAPVAAVLSANAKSISSSSKAQLALSRTVSVKTPERVSGVISHFTPADHRYDATGSVVINKGSAVAAERPRLSVVRAPSPVVPAPRPFKAPVKVQAAVATPSQSQASLSRTVSVKTPERASSVISHFNPADHRYEATGSVVINKNSASSPRAPRPAAIPAPVKARSFDANPAKYAPAQAPAASRSPSQLALSRTISVKTPERVSSVISHFTPAVNRYDATGSVTINRGSA